MDSGLSSKQASRGFDSPRGTNIEGGYMTTWSSRSINIPGISAGYLRLYIDCLAGRRTELQNTRLNAHREMEELESMWDELMKNKSTDLLFPDLYLLFEGDGGLSPDEADQTVNYGIGRLRAAIISRAFPTQEANPSCHCR